MGLPKAVNYIIVAYILCSILYTSTYLLGFKTSRSPFGSVSESTVAKLQERYQGKQSVDWKNELGQVIESTPEDLVLGKVFSETFGPSKVIPYYFKATERFDNEEITMATLVTYNRFKVLSRLASHYKGPVSAAIHVNDDDSKQQILTDLHKLYDENEDMRRYVDLHLVVDKFDRQFNMWRNVAKFFARTDYIMMLDVDFYLCTDFRKSLQKQPQLMELLRAGKAAVVVPAFEYVDESDGEDWNDFPKTKKELLVDVGTERLDMFHRGWTRGHGSTNYAKWYQQKKPYKVTEYNYSYEPYVIFKKEGTPWCDERFVGYGANKAACLFEIYLAGIDYWVLPDDFLIHQTHHYPEDTRAKERTYNKKLYDYYREETCLRYARIMIAADEWNTPKSANLKKECGRIRGFNDVIGRIAAEHNEL
ncbi:glycosyl-transferase for dystroglycan-domain-containing protein [Gilbertella persicaria]|uniref:glycosyl-transferase for dystroglycan-domain-containing protein n=1 Tax=Gilbertella persicaria TaxID=101096 RepID=UPI00221E5062|nr:glycosyl-transferase for dystroglycan-domain-containing protein [Gilbertella persicaria]KAI8052568.1 glycosyl-transferase for dystroglycan-domain-containing protein [Gilbertella persicaria]